MIHSRTKIAFIAHYYVLHVIRNNNTFIVFRIVRNNLSYIGYEQDLTKHDYKWSKTHQDVYHNVFVLTLSQMLQFIPKIILMVNVKQQH